MPRYNPKELEPKWQAKWEADKIYQASEDPAKPKKYVLEYFPYPSGAAMHVGHVRNYTIGDAIARHARMSGYNVLHPMGWDAFGLPAENYAIKNKVSPRVAIDENTDRFRQQLMQMGFSYDWSREIDSTDPKYYKWTQWFFLLLFKKGLAYQKESLQWWCPHDKTVLANEQVENGKCWRCGNEVEKKLLKQWFFKITDYADRLIDDLEDVNWSDGIKAMQRNWIGRSDGIIYTNKVRGTDLEIESFSAHFEAFTANTFVVLAPDHPFLPTLLAGSKDKDRILAEAKEMALRRDVQGPKGLEHVEGIDTGMTAIDTFGDEDLPIWIANYALADYGTGIVLCSAHDDRDWAFAKKYGLRLKPTMVPIDPVEAEKVKNLEYCFSDMKNGVLIEPAEFVGKVAGGNRQEIVKYLEHEGFAKSQITYKIRDWLISRQRYWGAPIPIIHCPNCIDQEIKEKSLAEIDCADKEHFLKIKDGTKTHITRAKDELNGKIKQGDIIQLTDDETSESVYAEVQEIHAYKTTSELFDDKMMLQASFGKAFASEQELRDHYDKKRPGYTETIDKNGIIGMEFKVMTAPVAVPEDQLPVLLPEVESYEPSGDGRSPLANVKDFVNTTCPKCGGPAERETDTMDGFACSSWYFLRFADPHNNKEPFGKDKAEFWLPVDDYIGGAEHAVMHLLYARFWTKVMYDEGLINFQEPFKTLRNQGMILAPDGVKMSKSKGNTIEPGVLIDQGYGADTIRIMELFVGPWNQAANWSVEGMGGSHRFLQRAWTLVDEYNESDGGTEESEALQKVIHKTIKKVSQDLKDLSFNTAIAAQMECLNELYLIKAQDKFASVEWQWALETFLQLLAPFAPHITEELWQELGQEDSIHMSEWPVHDEKYLVEDSMTIAVQVNGKLRGEVQVSSDATEQTIVEAAKNDQKVAAHLGAHEIRKTIYVPNKLVNFVI